MIEFINEDFELIADAAGPHGRGQWKLQDLSTTTHKLAPGVIAATGFGGENALFVHFMTTQSSTHAVIVQSDIDSPLIVHTFNDREWTKVIADVNAFMAKHFSE